MTTVLDRGAVALAEKLGLDLHYTKFIGESPHFTPCRCVGGPWLWAHAPEVCFRCGRYIDAAIGESYDDSDQEGLALLDARVEIERIRVLEEFNASGAVDYEEWLLARLEAT